MRLGSVGSRPAIGLIGEQGLTKDFRRDASMAIVSGPAGRSLLALGTVGHGVTVLESPC